MIQMATEDLHDKIKNIVKYQINLSFYDMARIVQVVKCHVVKPFTTLYELIIHICKKKKKYFFIFWSENNV